MNITIWFCDEWCPKCVDELVCLKTRNSGIALVIDGEIVKKMWKWKWMKMKMNENVIDEMIVNVYELYRNVTTNVAQIPPLGLILLVWMIKFLTLMWWNLFIHNMNKVDEWNSR